ncbi:MAG: hypothetical protein VKL42_22390 [Snowella sp.]|nr:hypothetical protein [Snowella sp.]
MHRTENFPWLLPQHQALLGKLEAFIQPSVDRDNAFFFVCNHSNLHLNLIQTSLPKEYGQPIIVYLGLGFEPQHFLQSLREEDHSLLVILGLENRPNPQETLIKLAEVKEKVCPQKHFVWLIGLTPHTTPIFRDMLSFLGGKTGWLNFVFNLEEIKDLTQYLWNHYWLDSWQIPIKEKGKQLQSNLDCLESLFSREDNTGKNNFHKILLFLQGLAQEWQGQYKQAVQSYQNYLTQETTTLAEPIPTVYLRLTYNLWQQARHEKNLSHPLWQATHSYLEKSLEILDVRSEQPERADSLPMLAQILRSVENWEQLKQVSEHFLIAYYQITPLEAKEISQSDQSSPQWTTDRLNQKLTEAYGYLAESLLEQWRFTEAKEALNRGLEIYERQSLSSPYFEAWLYYLSGRSHLGENNLIEAINLLEKSRKIALEKRDTDLILAVLRELRECYSQQGNFVQVLTIDQDYQAWQYLCGERIFGGIKPLGLPIEPEGDLGKLTALLQRFTADVFTHLYQWFNQPESSLLLLTGEAKTGKSSCLQSWQPWLHRTWPSALIITLTHRDSWRDDWQTQYDAYQLQGQSSDSVDLICLLEETPFLFLILDFSEDFPFLLTAPEDPFWRWLAHLFTPSEIPSNRLKVIVSLSPDAIALFFSRLTQSLYPFSLPPLQYQSLPPLLVTQVWGGFQDLLLRGELTHFTPLVNALIQDCTENDLPLHPLELQIIGSELEEQNLTTLESYQRLGSQHFFQAYIHRILALTGATHGELIQACLCCLAEDTSSSVLPLMTITELQLSLQANHPHLSGEWLQEILAFLLRSGLVKTMIINSQIHYQITTLNLAKAIRISQSGLSTLLSPTEPSFSLPNDPTLVENMGVSMARDQILIKLEKAESQYQRLLEGMRLERRSAIILKQFESQPLDSLLLAVKCGQELKNQLINSPTIADYPSLGPVFVLNQILNQIYECNRLQHRATVTCSQFSPDGQHLLTGSSDGKARLWTIAGRKYATLRGHQAPITDLQWSPNGHYIGTASVDTTAKIWDQSGQILTTLRGHDNRIRSIQFHPTLDLLATASRDSTIRLWNYAGEPVALAKGHQNWIRTIQFSPDGQYLLSASRDHTARLWQLNGQEFAVLQGHRGWVRSAQFSPDGKTIVTASVDGTARLWDLTGKSLVVFQGHQEGLKSAQFSPDGQTIITTSNDRTIQLWDIQGKHLATLQGHQKAVNEALFSPNGQLIVSTSADSTIRLWSRSGKPLVILRSHQKEVYQAVFHPNGRLFVTSSADHTARLWNLSEKGIVTLRGHSHWVRTAHFYRNGLRILTASRDKTARLWDEKGKLLLTLEGHQGWVREAQFSPDGYLIATASADHTAQLWNTLGKKLATLRGHQEAVLTVRFSPNGQYLLTASKDKTARIWQTSGQCLAVLRKHEEAVYCAEFSADGQFIVTATGDGMAIIWDIVGREIATCQGHQRPIYGVQFTLNNQFVLTASGDHTACLWDVTGRLITTFGGHEGTLYQAQFSPDEELIATASADKTARLWNRNGQELAVLYGHQGIVNSVQWSQDGQLIVTASEDGTARVWDRLGRELVVLQGHHSWVRTAEFSPDGQWVLTASTDGTAKVWPLASLDNLLNKGCEWLQDYLHHNPLVNPADRQLCSYAPTDETL